MLKKTKNSRTSLSNFFKILPVLLSAILLVLISFSVARAQGLRISPANQLTSTDLHAVASAPGQSGVMFQDDDLHRADPVVVAERLQSDALAPISTVITATKSYSLVVDNDNDGQADPGDRLKYTVVIKNKGPEDATDVTFSDLIDQNTTLIPGSFQVTPLAQDDTYVAVGNTTLVAGGAIEPSTAHVLAVGNILDNDFSGGGSLSVTSTGTYATTSGGSVNIFADGSFLYTPPLGFKAGNDTFQYTVDNGIGSDTAVVTISVNSLVWYVDNSAAPNGNGSSTAPFDSLAPLNGPGGSGDVDGQDDILFIYAGNSSTVPYGGGIELESGQQLIGEGVELVADGYTLVTPENKPTINNTGGDAVSLSSNNTIKGLVVGDTPLGAGISGSNVENLLITDVTIEGGGETLNINNGILDIQLDGLSSSNSTGNGLTLANVTGQLNVSSGSTDIINPFAYGLSITDSPGLITNFGDTTVTQAGDAALANFADGVNLTNDGSAAFTFGSLNITTELGAGLVATDSGTLTINGTANSINATNGASLDIQNTSLGSGATFSILTSSGSPDYGLNMNNVGGGLTANDGSIDTETGSAVLVNNATLSANFSSVVVTNGVGAGVSLVNSPGIKNITLLNVTNSNGSGLLADSAGTLNIADGQITTNNRTAVNINNTQVNINLGSLTANNSTGGGVVLTNLIDGSGFTVTGLTDINTTLSDGIYLSSPGSNSTIHFAGTDIDNPMLEGIEINSVGTGTEIILGDTTITSRTTTGILVDGMNGTTLDFGATTIANPKNAPGYGVRIDNSSAKITFSGVTINNPRSSVAEIIDASGLPTNDGDGDGIFYKNNTGSLAINAGLINNPAGDGIDVRDSANITLKDVQILFPGSDGVQMINLIGANTVLRSTINNFHSAGAGGIRVVSTGSSVGTLVVSSGLFYSASGGSAVSVNALGSSQVLLKIDNAGGLSGGSLFSDLVSNAINVNAEEQGTITAIIRDSIFMNARGVTGDNAINFTNLGNGQVNFLVENNSFDNVVKGTTDNAAINFNGSGNLLGKVRGNNLDNINGSCVASAKTAGHLDVTIDNNDCDNISQNGIRILLLNGSTADARITNNRLGTAVPVGNDPLFGGSGIELRALSGGAEMNATMTNNQVVTENTAVNAVNVESADTSTINLSVLNTGGSNLFISNSGSDFTAETVSGSAAFCLNLKGQTSRTFELNEAAGFFAIQNLNNVHTDNPGATVIVDTNITDYTDDSITCPVPPSEPPDPVISMPAMSVQNTQPDIKSTQNTGMVLTGLTKVSQVHPLTIGNTLHRTQSEYLESPRSDIAAGIGRGLAKLIPITQFTSPTYLSNLAYAPLASGEMVGISTPFTIPVGKAITLTFEVTIDNPFGPGTRQISNQGTISGSNFSEVLTDDPNEPGDQDPTITPVDAAPDLSIAKSTNVAAAVPGDTIIYTLSYSNHGNQDAQNVVVSETIPSGTSFSPVDSSSGWICTPDDHAGSTCSLDAGDVLADSSTANISFAIVLDNPVAFGISEVANQSNIYDDGLGGKDPNPDNNASDTVITPINASPNLIGTKAVADENSDSAAQPGEMLTYRITIANTGNEGAGNIVIEDNAPANTTFNSGSVSIISNTGGGTAVIAKGNAFGETSLEVDVDEIAGNGGMVVIEFTTTVDDPVSPGVTELTNTAQVTASGIPTFNTSAAVIPLQVAPDLQLTKDDGGTTAEPGDVIAYTLNYSNMGNQGATGVVITETLPANSSFDSNASSTGWMPQGAGIYTFELGTLAGGGTTGSITFAVAVQDPLPPGVTQIDNSATIGDDGSGMPDQNPGDNLAYDSTPLNAATLLSIRKDDGGVTVRPGDTLTYTLTISNTGNQDAGGVVITESLPQYTSFAGLTGWNAEGNGVFTYDLGILAGGGNDVKTLSFAVRVDDQVPSGITELLNIVDVSDDGESASGVPSTAQTSEATPLNATPDLQISKDDGGQVARPGETILYSLAYGNAGNQDASGVVITETVPAHTQFNPTSSSAGWSCSPNYSEFSQCTLLVGNLSASESDTVTFAVNIDDPLSPVTLKIINTTQIGDDGANGNDPNPADNWSTKITPVDMPLIITSITADPVTINENESLDLTVEFTDPGMLETHLIGVDWGDGQVSTLNLPIGTLNTILSHNYLDDDPSGTSSDTYSIEVRVGEPDGDSDNGSTSITVNNVAPRLSNISATTTNENGTTTLTGEIIDPGTLDTFSLTVDWGDDSAPEVFTYPAGTTNFSEPHQYLDDDPTGTPSDNYTISVTLADDDLGENRPVTTIVTVNNVSPVLSNISATTINENGTTTLSGAINDPGKLDTFSLTVDWGDGSNPEMFTYPAGTTNFNEQHQYLDDDPSGTPSDDYILQLTLFDDDTGQDTATSTVRVNNLAPSLSNVIIETPINEGGTTRLSADISDTGTQDTFSLTVDWKDGSLPETFTFPAGESSFSASHQYLDDTPSGTSSDTYAVSLILQDDDTGQTSASANVTVNDLPPTLSSLELTPSIDENGLATLSGDISDPNILDSFSLTLDWGDGSNDTIALPAGTTTFSQPHRYLDDNPSGTPSDVYQVKATLTDDDALSDTAQAEILVNNLAPKVNPGHDQEADEGSLVTLESTTVTDPGTQDTHTASIDWGDGTLSAGLVEAGNVQGSHIYPDNGTYTVTVTVSDDDGASGMGKFNVVVENVPPEVDAGDDQIAIADKLAGFHGTFTDPGASDTHELLWDLGDGTTITGTLTPVYTYTVPGTYTVTLTVTDDDGGVGSDSLIVTVRPPTTPVYLPLVINSGKPDLVGSFSLEPDKLAFGVEESVVVNVKITNQGDAPASNFWVDFYINPSKPPAEANDIWNHLCGMSPCYGVVWFVEDELGPGESISLRSTPDSYRPAYTIWPGYFAPGSTDLYLYVDTWNPGHTSGLVKESNESNNRFELHGLQVGASGANLLFDPLLSSPMLTQRTMHPSLINSDR